MRDPLHASEQVYAYIQGKINICQEYVIHKNAYANILLKENVIVVILLKINNRYIYMCP